MQLLSGFVFYFYNFRITSRLSTDWIWNAKIRWEFLERFTLLVSEIRKLTDTIIEVEKGCWCSGSLGLWWLLGNVGSLLAESDKKEVRSWEGGREEFHLAESSRWIVATEWILWKCAGCLYPDGHVSSQFWARANRIIRRANRQQVSWLCITEIWQGQV